jgi:DNA-binding NarL/FixJ family response regulator
VARTEALVQLDLAIDELRAMHMEPALERALRLRGSRQAEASSPRPVYLKGLSEREVEVLRLIAAGKRNEDIADVLVISPNTVARHVSHIFAKIGAANRAEAASFATRHGLA